MTGPIEVFADISCPFTHAGLRLIVVHLADRDPVPEIRVRAWPLEWVNGVPLDPEAVAAKIAVIREQLGEELFTGFRADSFPTTTIPALNLAAAAYQVDASTGLAVSLELREALFEQGLDVGRPEVLAKIAERHGLAPPAVEADPMVLADYEEGQRRGVRGSPDYFCEEAEFFCPSLDVGHDEAGDLTVELDVAGLERFLAAI